MEARTSEEGVIQAREGGVAGATAMQLCAERALRSRSQPISNLHIQTLRLRSCSRNPYSFTRKRMPPLGSSSATTPSVGE